MRVACRGPRLARGSGRDMKGLVTAALTTAIGALVAVPAAAAEPVEGREPVPEPVLAETVTDIDGTDVGELELRGQRGAAPGAPRWPLRDRREPRGRVARGAAPGPSRRADAEPRRRRRARRDGRRDQRRGVVEARAGLRAPAARPGRGPRAPALGGVAHRTARGSGAAARVRRAGRLPPGRADDARERWRRGVRAGRARSPAR